MRESLPLVNRTYMILHVDMDAFFAAIEQLDRPELRGKAILVGHDGPRGVVTTASYEARPYGCHSAQPMSIARRLCPHAIIVPVRGERYREVSRQVFDILHSVTPLVEPVSIDEAYLDVTGCERLMGDAVAIAKHIRHRIRQELHLTASVGVAPNKFLAKLASDMNKPDGLTVILAEDVDRVLPPLPVSKIWGLGPAAAAKFAELGVRTIADLRTMPLERLTRHFGSAGEHYHRLAHGIDDRRVTPDQQAKSIGEENTFTYDVAERNHVRQVLLGHVEQVARRLRRHGLSARRVTLKIRFGDFETITRSQTLATATNVTSELWQVASGLFDRWADQEFQPVRLIGMTAGELTTGPDQLGLFPDAGRDRQKRLDAVTDEITRRFGKAVIRRGGPPAR